MRLCNFFVIFTNPRNQVPEWASQYINYKGLKKLIKSAAAHATQTSEEPDLAGRSHGSALE